VRQQVGARGEVSSERQDHGFAGRLGIGSVGTMRLGVTTVEPHPATE
jgi:hypothetical protein